MEIKSGKNYNNFRALPKLVESDEFKIKEGLVLYNDEKVKKKVEIIYLPIYFAMFI